MEEKITCKNCNSDNIKFISEPIKIEKNASYLFIIACAFCSIIAVIGFIIMIYSIIKLNEVTAITNGQTVEDLLYAYFNYSIKLKEAQSDILTGIIILFAGLIPLIILLAFHSIAPSFSITTKTKAICKNCGRKWDFKAEREQQHERESIKE